MKLQNKRFIAIAAVVLFCSSSANANISNALQSVCATSGEVKITSNSLVSSPLDTERSNYRTKLASHFSETSCDGKRLIETGSDKLVNKASSSDTSNTLAVAPN
jgi:hypothetical protein